MLDDAEAKLCQSHDKYRDLYKFLPAHRRERDHASLDRAFEQHARIIDNLRESLSSPSGYEEQLTQFYHSLRNLKMMQFDFREVVWGHTGPSSHPGLNELLRIIESQDEDALSNHLEHEWDRLDFQDEASERLPPLLRPIFKELFEDLRVMLESLVEALEEPDCWSVIEEIKEDLLEWGLDYSRHDIDGLRDRCSGAPTGFPDVNFTLNARRLYLEDYIPEELSDFANNRARNSLARYAKWVKDNQDLMLEHQADYLKLQKSLNDLLPMIRKAPTLQHVYRLGKMCIPIVEKMAKYQRRFSR